MDQHIENQRRSDVVGFQVPGTPPGTFPAVGCMTKKRLCFSLRPHLLTYQSYVILSFFTADRLERCGLTVDQLRRIRIFPPEATAVIIDELATLKIQIRP